MKVTVMSGNIGDEKSDALITTVNSSGLWFGAIDSVIQKYAGYNAHSSLRGRLHLLHECSGVSIRTNAPCKFANVIFIIDDLNHDLWVPIYNALDIAEFHRYTVVSIPLVRYGVMLGVKEKTIEAYVEQFSKGIKEWLVDNDNPYLKEIKVVVYNDPNMESLLKKVL